MHWIIFHSNELICEIMTLCLLDIGRVGEKFIVSFWPPFRHNVSSTIAEINKSPTIAKINKSNFLDVIIDNTLSWKDHISFERRNVARGIGVIIKARKVLHSESLKWLYYSIRYPYMINCNKVWGSACKTNIEPLLILQNSTIRIIPSVHPRSPSEPLFITLKFLNCENILDIS